MGFLSFPRYCCDLGIKYRYSTANKVIVDGLKKRLRKNGWASNPMSYECIEQLPKRSTRETPFSKTYGSEAIIPTEIGFLTMRFDQFIGSDNEQLLSFDLDLTEE